MALRSVVLALPPGAGAPRRTVVLRPGGPKDKGRAADAAAGVAGALLLLACAALVVLLPDKEYALPQFQLAFPDTQSNSTTQRFDFLEGDEASRVHSFSYDLPDNVQSITMVVEFTDDVAASLPDQFRVELFDPRGNPAGARQDIIAPAPLQDANDPTAFTPQLGQARITHTTVPHPTDEIVQGLSHKEVKEQVKARLEPRYRVDTAGTWTVRVTLVNANDCPQPADPDANPFQVMACRGQRTDGTDPGNPFALANFIVTTYTVQVEDLS